MNDQPSDSAPRDPQMPPFRPLPPTPSDLPLRTRHGALVDWSVFNALPIRLN